MQEAKFLQSKNNFITFNKTYRILRQREKNEDELTLKRSSD